MTDMGRWDAALALAVRLGVPPAAFWRLSVPEWRAVSGSALRGDALPRVRLDDLMKQHPDR